MNGDQAACWELSKTRGNSHDDISDEPDKEPEQEGKDQVSGGKLLQERDSPSQVSSLVCLRVWLSSNSNLAEQREKLSQREITSISGKMSQEWAMLAQYQQETRV